MYQSNVGRSAYIWNLLYPKAKINPGDYCYIFSTNLYSENDIKYLQFKEPDTYKMLNGLIFNNEKEPELKKYGMGYIAIPATVESVASIPSWLIRHIDYAGITNKHLQPIISLLPSIGLHMSKLSGTKRTYSPIISY
jgi:hypothetical protein